ncbi:MAG: glycosyl/glycerophosphate transferase, partial [Microbacteriaceae bacterium]|nr:glycosyl/glycerophosphate transferase [Microbacteriaceae bacterium]
VPRRLDLWVFGSGPGVGEGALALYRHARQANADRTYVWLARDAADRAAAARLGVPAVIKGSARGFWCTLRAGVVVVTHGFGDANRYGLRGAFVVQLWHGIPLKLINLDSPATLRSRLLPNSRLVRGALRHMYRTAARSIDLMPAASEVSATRLRSAFDLPAHRVVVTGDPRDDILLTGSDTARTTEARDRLFAALGIGSRGDRVLLYAPTWRDGEVDPGVPTATEWRSIADFLEAADALLVVRPHPHGVGDYADGFAISDRIRLLSVADCTDVTTVLSAIEVLITDYSSIAYDFALTGRPIAFLAPDVDRYTTNRGLYVPYSTFSGSRETRSWGELLDLLELLHTDPAVRKRLAEHSEMLAGFHHAHRDGRNTERVYLEITTRLKEHR